MERAELTPPKFASRHACSRFGRRFLRHAVPRSCCGEVRVVRGELCLTQRRWISLILETLREDTMDCNGDCSARPAPLDLQALS